MDSVLTNPELSPARRSGGVFVLVVVALAALASNWATLARLHGLPRTDDASIGADVAHLSTGVPGRVAPLAADGIASQQMLDEVRSAAADAEVSLRVARQSAAAEDDLVAGNGVVQAEVATAEAALALAEHTHGLTELSAPFDGHVTGLTARPGRWILPEQQILNLIDTGSWHVEACICETDLDAVGPGDPVRVHVLSHGNVALRGTVASIGRGVLPGTDRHGRSARADECRRSGSRGHDGYLRSARLRRWICERRVGALELNSALPIDVKTTGSSGVFVGVSVPIYDGGLRENRLRAADDRVASSRAERAALIHLCDVALHLSNLSC